MLKKLFSHTLIYGLAPYIPSIVSFFTLPIITKDLTSLDYGISGIISAYVGIISSLSTLGLRISLINSFYHSKEQYKWLWREIYGFLNLWMLIYALGLSILLFFAIPIEARNNSLLIIILNVLPLVLFGPTSLIGTTYYQLNQKPLPIAIRTAFSGILGIFLNVVLISGAKLGYMGWFYSTFITTILVNFSYWYPVNKIYGITPIFNFKRKTIKKMLVVALPIIPHSYSSYLINGAERVIMDLYKINTDLIGKYNIALNFGRLFSSFGDATGFAIGPILFELYKRTDFKTARNLIFIVQSIYFFITFTFCLWTKEIFELLIKNQTLNQSYPLAIILIMAINYRPMYFGANQILFYKEKTKELLRITFLAGSVCIALNILLIPLFGYKIVVFSSFASYMYWGYAGFFFRSFKDNNPEQYFPLVWLPVTITLTIIAYFAVEINILSKIIVSVFCVIAFIILLMKSKNLLNATLLTRN